ncbi:unnamed protein product [Chironomus riparius]|uniref:Uncharacterized protein n=1 Tax=Chironomus riparius TaxID=315576 RepID=A0A9N9RS83_9DIPT|nr:unnamed protein product [Chironomus riparius]
MKVLKLQIFFLISTCLKCANSDRLLAIQRFGAGYPSFHSISMGNDGGLICANFKCRNPPHLCRIQSKSDQSRNYLMTTIDCIGPRMVISNRWSIRQESPNNRKYIDILTEADLTGEILNTQNIEKGDEKFIDLFLTKKN